MSEIASEAVKGIWDVVRSVIYDRIKTYLSYIQNYEQNLNSLSENLETLCLEKKDVDVKVLSGRDRLEKLTFKAAHWLARVQDFSKDEEMKKLMTKDMGIAKAMLRLMKNADLKKLVEKDGEMRDLVVEVMKDIAKRKRRAGNAEVSEAEEKDKEVGRVLEKLMEETMDEFKTLMQNDTYMAVAAMHLLENHMENLERLTEKDKEVADIIAKAREMSQEAEWLSHDNDDNVLVRENTLREKVTNLLKPVGEVILNEELLKVLPENVALGMEAMGIVIGNRKGLKAELMDADNASNHRNCCCCVFSYNYFSDRHDTSVAAAAMLDKIKIIIGDKPGNQDLTRPVRREEMEGIPTNFVGLESRNELLLQIVKALTSNDVHAVGVFGMGGSGKTLLAKEVANTKARGMFAQTVMVEISEAPKLECIQDEIANGLGLDLHNVHGIHEKAIRLYNKLKQGKESERTKDDDNTFKKILIVLDNIWKEIDLVQIGIPREYCKLLLTSREREVCKAMNVQEVNIFELGLLNKDEANDLFKFQVQREVNGEYKFVADRLLEKCGGLPLSIVATSNSLKGKDLPLWRLFLEELEKPISCQIRGLRQETFSILRTSYEIMESEAKKKFFLMACLSPVGASISIDNLMRYGIGLDLFQHVNKLSEAIECAHTWAKELVSASMLLKDYSEEYVKIHDIVRECTVYFASKTGLNSDREKFLVDDIPRWICKETFNQYTGISLLSQANYARLNGVKANLLQILLLEGNVDQSSFLESNFFQGMTNLKVLEMSTMNFMEGLPESIGKLKDLKTLHLVQCKLGDIKLIGELESLLVLSLCLSSFEVLPDEIGKLSNLRLLDMSRCWCKQPRIPVNVIARLSLLEGLYLHGSSFTKWAVTESTSNDTGITNGADMHDLSRLEFLNVLEICIFEPISFPTSTQFVKSLDKFKINLGQNNFEFYFAQRFLSVSNINVSQELGKNNCLKALLKKADFLSIKSATIKNIVPELDEEGFRDLSHLQLYDIHSIRRICEGKVPTELFLNLCHLGVSVLKNLEELLPVKPLPHKLTTLLISDCNSLSFIFSESGSSSASNDKESDIIELCFLKTLYLNFVSSLISVVKESSIDDSGHTSFFNSKVKMPSLEEVKINCNKSIVKLWGKESNMRSFQNLKVLQIGDCEKMETIGPPSMFLSLVQLESLEVLRCSKMQQVISEESERQEIPQGILTFPKLKFLGVAYSENFKCFYGGSYKMEFPQLQTMEFKYLESMTKFAGCGSSTTFLDKKIEFPCLERLWLEQLSDKVAELWNLHELMAEGEDEGISLNLLPKLTSLFIGKIKLPSIVFQCLSRLVIEAVGDAKFIFSSLQNEGCVGAYSQFPKLEELSVQRCPNSTELFVEDDGSTAVLKFCGQLSYLVLNSALNMEIISLHPFKSLRRLCISLFAWEYLFSADGGFEQLQSLEDLRIWNCPNLEVIVRGNKDNAVVFPQLKRLFLWNLEHMSKFCSISDIPFHFPSLEHLDIASCNKLGTLCSGSFVAPSLKELNVNKCNELQWLFSGEPNQVIELPSLENVAVNDCDAVKSFLTRPLKAPKLRKLHISECPKMEWFLLGNSNCGADLELLSLESVIVKNCPNMKSFSPAAPRAPKLWRVTVDEKPCPIDATVDLNHLLKSANSSEQTETDKKLLVN